MLIREYAPISEMRIISCETGIIFKRIVMVAVLSDSCQSVVHMVWCRPRTKDWWEAARSGMFVSEWWKENQRMAHDTFAFVCSQLCPYIEKQVSNLAGYVL